MTLLQPETIYRARAVPIEEELARRGIKLRGRGADRAGPCPVCGGTDRFSVNTRKQLWLCRKCEMGGGVVDLVMHIDSVTFPDAVMTLTGEEPVRGEDRPWPKASPSLVQAIKARDPLPPRLADEEVNRKRAMAIWNAAIPIANTPAETYLTRRLNGLTFADPDGDILRFHPRCRFGDAYHPCMVALFREIISGYGQDGDNRPVGIHRTALLPDGSDKIGKKMLGSVSGAAIKLSDDADVTMGLTIGEGIESTLAGMLDNGFTPAWALGSAGGIAKFPIISGIESLTILVDNDHPNQHGRKAGHAAARECSTRWLEARRDVTLIVPRKEGTDMADLLAHEEARRAC